MICKLMGNHRTRNMSSNLVCNHMLLGVVIRATPMNLPDFKTHSHESCVNDKYLTQRMGCIVTSGVVHMDTWDSVCHNDVATE